MTKYYIKGNDDEYSEVEGELLTQAQVNSVVKSRAEQMVKQDYADYEDLKAKASNANELAKDFQTKLAEANDKVINLTSELQSSALEVDKVKLMSEFKLSEDMSEFIVGDTAEEMRRRAEKLAKSQPEGLSIEKTNSREDESSGTNKELAKDLLGSID